MTTATVDNFDGLIGQQAVKRKLNFYIEAFQKSSQVPFVLFSAAKGTGKTAFARSFAKSLCNADGSKRPLIELNCSTIKNNRTFFENIFLQYINGNNVTVLFDECHNLPNDLSQALLTICNTEAHHERGFNFDGQHFTFNFKKISFLFATTEADKLFPPLKDRFDVVDFEPYTQKDLSDIIKVNADSAVFLKGVIEEATLSLRGNARSAVRCAEHINLYLQRAEKATFGMDDWKNMCYHLNILPEGLTNTELAILKELEKRGDCTLQTLASVTGMSRTSIQKDVEQFLLKKNFIKIEGLRKITASGRAVLERVRNWTPPKGF